MRTKQKTFPGLRRLHSALQWVKKLNHQKPQGLCEKRRWHRAKGCPGLEGAGRAGVGDPMASLSFTVSWSLLKLMSIESVMQSNHLTLCHPLLLLPSIFPNIRIFSNELALHIRWPEYWSFSFNISLSNEYSG